MKRILLWLSCQKRPLSQAEFVAAADLPSPAAVTEICSRVLIETTKESIEVAGRSRMFEVFRFTHFSVQEYLNDVFSRTAEEPEALNKSSKIARFVPRLGEEAHCQITRRCIVVLSACRLSPKTRTNATAKTGSDTDWDHGDGTTYDSDDTSHDGSASDDDFDANGAGRANYDSEEDRQSTSARSSAADGGCPEGPARRYAAKYWFRHYEDIVREKVPDELCGQLHEVENEICSQVLGDANKMRFWLRTYDPDGEVNETAPSPVYYAVRFDFKAIFMRLITQVAQLPADATDRRVAFLDQPGPKGTALQLAAHQGDLDVLEKLIEHKADINSKKGLHGTALYASAARGNRDAVYKLLRAGAKLDDEDHGDFGSPLHVAAFRGHVDIVKLLLEEGGLAVDHRAHPFGTALQAASAARQFSTVKLLLQKKADPNIVGGCLGTAAQAASVYDEGQLNPRDNVIEELRSRDAQFVDGPLNITPRISPTPGP
jgi:Ankyrin repeats (3 copies)